MSQKLANLGKTITYSAQVVGHMAREVAIKEKFGPPSLAELGQAQAELQTALKNIRSGKVFEYTVAQAVPKIVAGFSVFSFFIVGEIIGRFHIIGYKN